MACTANYHHFVILIIILKKDFNLDDKVIYSRLFSMLISGKLLLEKY